MRAVLLALLALLVAAPAAADLPDPSAAPPLPGNLSGRIEARRPGTTCGAALIASDLVVTAGHCLGPRARRVLRPADGGAPVAVVAAHRHPDWDRLRGTPRGWAVDLSLGVLADPLPAHRLDVRPIGPPPVVGEVLILETWLRPAPEPKRRDCPVVRLWRGLAVLGCPLVSGHSGAPVFRRTPDGPELVAIAVARMGQGPATTGLAAPLAPMRDVLRAAAGRR